jgi:acyl carrier protein
MSATGTVAQQVRNFIVADFLYGQERPFQDDDSFLGEGLVDSTGVLQLVAFLEETYGITVEDDELTPENLDSVNSVAAYVCRKVNPVAEAAASTYESARGEKS